MRNEAWKGDGKWRNRLYTEYQYTLIVMTGAPKGECAALGSRPRYHSHLVTTYLSNELDAGSYLPSGLNTLSSQVQSVISKMMAFDGESLKTKRRVTGPRSRDGPANPNGCV